MVALIIGQALLSFSALHAINLFWLACIARFIIGLGGKNISVCRTTYSSDWFIGKELSFALALSIGVSRLGAISVMALSPIFYESTKSLAYAFWFGMLFVLLSTICGVAAMLIDQHVINKSGYKREEKKQKSIKFSDITHLGLGFWLVGITICTWYLAFNCFINISNQFAVDKFGISSVDAGYLAVFF